MGPRAEPGVTFPKVGNFREGRVILLLILILFTALGALYSVVVPPFEASDELWHYPMVQYIADHWALPVQDPANVGPWRQEGSQPPLYYALAAAATFWIDTSDMDTVRHLNPHVDNGVATPDGNINLVVHRLTREAFPWRGTALAVHLVRLLSVLMGTAAVYLTYLIVREVLPDEPALALGAAAIHAFTPMFVFISGAVNNDNLVVPLSSLALLMLLRLADREAQIAYHLPESWEPSGRSGNPQLPGIRFCAGPGGADEDQFAGADGVDGLCGRSAGGAPPFVGRIPRGRAGDARAAAGGGGLVVSA